ncbi:MAG: hypothetical protein A07HR67_01864 [uncultured archaeon A07HR67]|nr:MAG: hypothetical protein A07HR67_01864 [uncultured archaeon A07HR67]
MNSLMPKTYSISPITLNTPAISSVAMAASVAGELL